MAKKRLLKLLLLNFGIILLNVVLFSRGFVGLTFGDDIIMTALGITVIVMSVIAFFWGNISILFSNKTPVLYNGTEFNNEKDYVEALEEKRDKKVFSREISAVVEQVSRIRARNDALDTILKQHFSPQEMTSVHFRTVIDSVNELFYNNVKKMLNRITIFDDRDYTVLMYKLKYSTVNIAPEESQSLQAQLNIYKEHIDYVKNLVDMNEGIIVKLDRLLLELSKLDDFDENNIESMTAIQEMNDLINQTKFYKQ